MVLLIGITISIFLFSEKISKNENRVLSSFPNLIEKGTINDQIGPQIETYLKDHFPARASLIRAQFQIMYKMNGRVENEKAFVGKDGHLFMKWGSIQYNTIKEQRKVISHTAKMLQNFNNRFQNKNVHIYVAIMPDKGSALPDSYKQIYKPANRLDFAKELAQQIPQKNIHVINLNEPIKNQPELFYAAGTHINERGLLSAAQYIYDKIQKDQFPDFHEEITTKSFIKKADNTNHNYIGLVLGIVERHPIVEQAFAPVFSTRRAQHIERKKYKQFGLLEGWGDGTSNYYTKYKSLNPVVNQSFFGFGICYGYQILQFFSPVYRESSYVFFNNRGAGKQSDDILRAQIKKSLHEIKGNDTILIVVNPITVKDDLQALSDEWLSQ